ncbi:unnamed protein product, partial [Symbiodinium necroappetens]
MTLWAQVAPHRPQGNKQHFLKPAPVPLLPAKTSPLDGKLVRVEKPAVFDADGKETSPAQNRALNQREVPTGCQIVDIDKDGSCLYRAVAQGLTWLSGKKKTEHCHRDLRARANAHLRKHQAQYVDEWDGAGPALEQLAAESLTKAEGFAKYLDLAEKESAYGSVLELKALSRIYDVCLMVIPRDANFGTMVFKEAKAQKHRAIVLWYTPKHIALVRPTKPTDHYPEALFSGSTGQVIDLRAGGRSCHPSEEEGSVWTRASNAPSIEAPPVPDSEIRRRKDNKPDRFRLPQGPDMKYRLLFKCELCPYRTTRADPNNLSAVKAHHTNTCHGGEGQLPKIASHKWFASRGKVEDFHWRCPLCRTGVKKVRNEISTKRLYQLKRQHKDQCHPEVSRSEWLTLMRAPTANSAAQKKRALRLGKSNVEAVRLKLPPHIIPFTMPRPVRSHKGPFWCILPFSSSQLDDATFASEPRCEGAPLAKFISLLTCNLARKGIASVDAVRAMLSQESVQIAAFQEADINPLSAAGFVAAWRRHKYQAVLSPVDSRGMHRVALGGGVANFGGPYLGACGLFLRLPGRRPRTSLAFDSLMSAVATFGGPFVVLGDYNITQMEGSLAAMLATGAIRAADDTGGSLHPNTNPTNTCRIDFAVTHQNLVACHVRTFRLPAVSDHGIVRVDFPTACFPRSWKRPAFSPALAPADAPASEALAQSSLHILLLGKEGHEPAPLSALRRLARRLSQLEQQPWDSQLLSSIARSLRRVRALTPDLPHLDLDSPVDARASVDSIIDTLQQQHRQHCLQRWKEKTALSSDAALAWVKNRADLELRTQSPSPLQEVPIAQVHPAQRVQLQGEEWTRKWQTPTTPPDCFQFAKLLQDIPSHPTCHLDLEPNPTELRKATKQMRKRAPGPDGWTGDLLLRLPDSFWTSLSALWAQVIRTATIPSLWQRSIIVLLEKGHSASRPIALLPLVWRAGARVIARRLKGWICQWCDHRATGSAPGRSPIDMHRRLLCAWKSGVRSYLQQDISAFFDSLLVPVLKLALAHLGAPPTLAPLIEVFYSRQLRLFTVDSYTSERWHRSHHGLLQGCPLSPFLSLTIGFLWAQHVTKPGVEAGIYVDDRILWLTGQDQSKIDAQNALRRSDSFDAAAGLTCSCRKCHLVTTQPCCPWRAEAEARGYQIGPTLQYLGVELCLDSGEAVPLKLSLHKLQVRLRHTANPAFPFEVRRQVIRSLVFPAKYRGRVLGWTLDVSWVADWSALAALTRALVQQPDWHEHLSLQELAFLRTSSLPGASSTLQKLQWRLDPQGRAFERVDDAGRHRTYRFGEDSPEVLKQWLTEAHKAEATHRQVYAKATTRAEKHAALACGGTGWHFSTRHSLTGPVQCLCSKLWPSRAHLLWSCPNFAEERTRLPTPVDRVEERLLGRPILEYPPAPATGVQALQPQVLHLLEQAAAENQLDLLFATDGSSEQGIGAFAAVCQHPRLDIAGADSSEDQTPFRMELLGILGVLEALELTARPPRQVTILVDCVRSPDDEVFPGRWFGLQAMGKCPDGRLTNVQIGFGEHAPKAQNARAGTRLSLRTFYVQHPIRLDTWMHSSSVELIEV